MPKPNLKNLVKDESAVSYLILVGVLLSLAAFSIVWMMVSDMADLVYAIYAIVSTNLGVSGDVQADWGFDAVMFMLKITIVAAPSGILWWAYQKSTKPMDPYL